MVVRQRTSAIGVRGSVLRVVAADFLPLHRVRVVLQLAAVHDEILVLSAAVTKTISVIWAVLYDHL